MRIMIQGGWIGFTVYKHYFPEVTLLSVVILKRIHSWRKICFTLFLPVRHQGQIVMRCAKQIQALVITQQLKATDKISFINLQINNAFLMFWQWVLPECSTKDVSLSVRPPLLLIYLLCLTLIDNPEGSHDNFMWGTPPNSNYKIIIRWAKYVLKFKTAFTMRTKRT